MPTSRSWSATAAKAWEGYRKAAQRVLQLGRDKKQQDAADISDGMASMAVDEAMGAIDQLSTFNFKHAEQASQHANVVYQRTRNGMLALLAVALLSGLGLAVWFTRRLLRQLGGSRARRWRWRAPSPMVTCRPSCGCAPVTRKA